MIKENNNKESFCQGKLLLAKICWQKWQKTFFTLACFWWSKSPFSHINWKMPLLAKSKKIWIAKVGVRVKSDLWFFCPAGGYFLKKLSKKDHTLAWVAIFIKAFWNCKILVSERVFNEEFILFPEEKNICMQSYPEWS